MNLKQKKIFTTSLFITTLVGVIFSNPNTNNDPTIVSAEALSFVIGANNFSGTLTNDGTEKLGSITVSNVEVTLATKNSFKTTSGNTTYLELTRNNAGVLYNTTPLPGTINTVNIKQKTGITNTLYIGNTNRLINNVTGNVTISNNIAGLTLTASSISQDFTSSTFSSYSNLSYFAFVSSSGNESQIESITFNMTVNQAIITNYKVFNFASDIFFYTDNKAGQCTEAGLSWGQLKSLWLSLSSEEQTLFKTSSDATIVSARNRYIYLRTININLENFASL